MNNKSFIDVRQTPEYAHYMRALGWQRVDNRLCKELKCNFFYKKIPFLPFYVGKILRFPRLLNKSEVKSLLENKIVLALRQEPGSIEKQSNDQIYFKVPVNTKWTVISTKTLRIDLALSENGLLSRMKPKTRYNLRLAQKNSVVIQIIDGDKVSDIQLKQFFDLWVVNPPHDRFFKPKYQELEALVRSFGNKCFLLFAFDNSSTPIAVLLILTTPNMAFYWHNASNRQGKQLFAPTLNVWQAIKESKKRGLKVFDFESVWDERFPNWVKGWKGFTTFKEGFVKK